MDDLAARLTSRLDALAAGLRAAGASAEASTRLLEAAAVATLEALALRRLLEEPAPAPAPAPAPVALEPARRESVVRLAA